MEGEDVMLLRLLFGSEDTPAFFLSSSQHNYHHTKKITVNAKNDNDNFLASSVSIAAGHVHVDAG